MKVKCSGARYEDPIDTETCIQCAKDLINPPCGYSAPLVKAMLSGKADAEQRLTSIHVSDVITCQKKAFLSKSNPQPKYLHELLVLLVGTAVHEKIEKEMEDDEDFVLELKVARDVDANTKVEGRLDILSSDGKVLVDTKTTRWLNVEKLPYSNHIKQVRAYANMLNDMPEDVYIQYIDVNGASKCRKCKVIVEPMKMGHEVIMVCPNCGQHRASYQSGAAMVKVPVTSGMADLDARAQEIHAALESGVEPDGEPGWICQFCEFSDTCMEGSLFLSTKK